MLKALTVLLICAAIFRYYLGSLRWDKQIDLARARAQSLRFGVGSAAVAIVAFCVGLGLVGTPSAQRHLEADSRRVQDLKAIAASVHSKFMWADMTRLGKSLPSSLTELASYGINGSQLSDPETKVPYDYRPRTSNTYELCAAFSQASERVQPPAAEFWFHGKGQTCFALDAAVAPSW